MANITITSTTTWTVPAGVTSIVVECIGGGGSGASTTSLVLGGGGGAGGAYARRTFVVTPGEEFTARVGAGSYSVAGEAGIAGGYTEFYNNGATKRVLAKGGTGGNGTSGGYSPTGNIGDVTYAGGAGGAGSADDSFGGGGGGAGGPSSSGGNGGSAGAGGYGGASDFGDGGSATSWGQDGFNYGGGGGGAGDSSNSGAGSPGVIYITTTEGSTTTTTTTIGYCWNKLRMKKHNGSSWVAGTLRKHNGSSWAIASIRSYGQCIPTTTTTTSTSSTTTTTTTAYNQLTNIKNSLVACWEFDDTSNVTCYDKHSSIAMSYGSGVSFNTVAPSGFLRSVSLNGSTGSYIRSNNNNVIPNTTDITVTLWFRSSAVENGNSITLWSIEGAYTCYLDTLNLGGMRVSFSGSMTGTVDIGHYYANDTWHFFAATNNGTTTYVYLNGTQVATYSNTRYNLDSLTRQTAVGARFDGSVQYACAGQYAQFAVWSRVLTTSEITALYSSNRGVRYANW